MTDKDKNEITMLLSQRTSSISDTCWCTIVSLLSFWD